MPPIFRAPVRPRDRDAAPGVGADHAIGAGLVGTGDRLDAPPATLAEAVAAAARQHGEKAGRMLERFAALPAGTFVWTRTSNGLYALGRIAGAWHYDDSRAAHAAGIHHVRATDWASDRFGPDAVPVAVAETFARGGRNLQRIHSALAEEQTAALWPREIEAG